MIKFNVICKLKKKRLIIRTEKYMHAITVMPQYAFKAFLYQKEF